MSNLLTNFFLLFIFFFLSSSTLHCFLVFFLFFPRRSILLIVACLFLFFRITSFNSSIFLCPFRWCRVVMLKTVVYGNQVCFESLKNSTGTSTKLIYVVYIYILDTYQRNDNRRRKEDARRLLYKYIHLSLYCKGSKGLFKGLHVRGCWRPNINFIFWPHCYDRHVVSFLFSWCWGPLHRGFSEGPLGRVWLSLPHLVSRCLEFYWQLLCHPTQLNYIIIQRPHDHHWIFEIECLIVIKRK